MTGNSAFFKVAVGIYAVDHFSKHIMHLSNLTSQASKNIASANKLLTVMGGVATMAIGTAATGAMVGFIKSSAEAAEELERVKLKLQGVGKISADQRKAIMGDVRNLTNLYPLTQAESLKTAIDLHTVLGDVGHARQALPQALRLKSALGIYFKDMDTSQVYDAYRSAELASAQGGKPASMQAIMSRVDTLTKIVVGSGGKIDFSQLLGFTQQNKLFRTTMTNEGYYGIARLIQEMKSGSTAGTALQALSRAALQGRFGTSTQGKSYISAWARMGLLDSVLLNGHRLAGGAINPDAIEARGSKVRDVRIKDLSTLMADPQRWGATTLTEALRRKGINVDNNAAVQRAIGPMTGNINLQQMLGMLITQRGAFQKDREITRASANSNSLFNIAMASYPGQKQAFGMHLKQLSEAVGTTLVPLFLNLYKALNPLLTQLTGFVKNHPSLTRFAVLLGLLGGVFTLIAGAAVTAVGVLGVGGLLTALTGFTAGPVLGIAGTITAIVAGLSILGAGLVAFWDKISSFAQKLIGNLWNSGRNLWNTFSQDSGGRTLRIGQMTSNPKHTIAGAFSHQNHNWTANSGGITNHFNISGVTDPKEVARVVRQEFQKVGKQ